MQSRHTEWKDFAKFRLLYNLLMFQAKIFESHFYNTYGSTIQGFQILLASREIHSQSTEV